MVTSLAYRRFWTHERDSLLSEAWLAGSAPKDIADMIGVSKTTIFNRVRTLKLPRRQKPRFAVETKTRRCLKCKQTFVTDVYFRCQPCREQDHYIAPMAEGFGL